MFGWPEEGKRAGEDITVCNDSIKWQGFSNQYFLMFVEEQNYEIKALENYTSAISFLNATCMQEDHFMEIFLFQHHFLSNISLHIQTSMRCSNVYGRK